MCFLWWLKPDIILMWLYVCVLFRPHLQWKWTWRGLRSCRSLETTSWDPLTMTSNLYVFRCPWLQNTVSKGNAKTQLSTPHLGFFLSFSSRRSVQTRRIMPAISWTASSNGVTQSLTCWTMESCWYSRPRTATAHRWWLCCWRVRDQKHTRKHLLSSECCSAKKKLVDQCWCFSLFSQYLIQFPVQFMLQSSQISTDHCQIQNIPIQREKSA